MMRGTTGAHQGERRTGSSSDAEHNSDYAIKDIIAIPRSINLPSIVTPFLVVCDPFSVPDAFYRNPPYFSRLCRLLRDSLELMNNTDDGKSRPCVQFNPKSTTASESIGHLSHFFKSSARNKIKFIPISRLN